MKYLKLINLENVSNAEADAFNIREAARAIVFDEDQLIALLHSTKNHYYKLPGGGIEQGEDMEMALKRECMEEIGCMVEIIKEVGMIIEYRKKFNIKQTSYCYIAKLVGKKDDPRLEQDEIEEGFETVWLPYEQALNILRESKPVTYQGPYMVTRDTAFLETGLGFMK